MTQSKLPPAFSPSTFASRHIGPTMAALWSQLAVTGPQGLVDAAIPPAIRTDEPLNLPPARSETEVLEDLRRIAGRNRVLRQMIGQGYFPAITPPVIRRNVLESPAWYTAYTPYQPEIAQGRLEALLNFQTMVEDLTGLPVAGASLLDEATAVAEAVSLMWRATRAKSGFVLLDADLYPQTLAVVRGRAEAIGLPIVVADLTAGLDAALAASGENLGALVGVVVQQCGASGRVYDWAPVISDAKDAGAMVTIAADLLALALLRTPGELNADIAVGSAQRFGVPLFYGGPHAAFMSVRTGLERSLPGRLVGVSVDADGDVGYRLALQTREQHIRREKATSNICTAQALLAVVASMYAVYHGPAGLQAIAQRVHDHAATLANLLVAAGFELDGETFFDTVRVRVPGGARAVVAAGVERGINMYAPDADHVQISCSETTTPADLAGVLGAFGCQPPVGAVPRSELPQWSLRETEYLTHPVFNTHHTETAMLRYLRRLADKDLALDRSMIPLGSCTMKLNATAQMEPISWPEFADLHPYVPADQAEGYAELIDGLEAALAEITGYAAVSVQPNSGAQGEFAGLLAIRRYHLSRGHRDRDVCLIPASAHGTNAASAAMAGLKVRVVKTAENGEIDLADLKEKVAADPDRIAAIMITYPSTHGVYEEHVTTVCELVHQAGGQVYIDGANLNALVGLAKPGEFGGDVSHLNLHKTFCIPHGGGGPGVGPIAVAEHLRPYLPGDPRTGDTSTGHGDPALQSAVMATVPPPVAAARYGSAGILPISWAYLALMGPDGLKDATIAAVASANYLAKRLNDHYPVLYTGPGGLVAHECILDLRPITAATAVTAEDVAKRLMDYGFHAPTLAFPVAGTLMVEPTESEDLGELDRFIDAMISIRHEIDDVAQGRWDVSDSPLRGAPHTAACLVKEWKHPYTREEAVYPVASLRENKYWPPVRRIDGARGDRNLVCACPPVESYAE